MRQDVLSAPLLPYFTPLAIYLFLKVKSRLANCLLTQGTFKNRAGGRPHHPVVDRALQKKHIANDHGQKLP
jgi:hypothetical protein